MDKTKKKEFNLDPFLQALALMRRAESVRRLALGRGRESILSQSPACRTGPAARTSGGLSKEGRELPIVAVEAGGVRPVFLMRKDGKGKRKREKKKGGWTGIGGVVPLAIHLRKPLAIHCQVGVCAMYAAPGVGHRTA